ncbi:hypothetical protein ACTUM0_04830 [Schaalia turicensis]|uniref:hypothetical protein n=1 Tax=Schaalia turicensis TaxID=131111 RepID=UPI003FA416CD
MSGDESPSNLGAPALDRRGRERGLRLPRERAASPSACFRSIIAYVEGSRVLPVSGIPGSEIRVPEARVPAVPAD